MAAAAFCSMSHGYGVRTLNDYLSDRRGINRIYQVLSLQDAVRIPSCSKMYFSKTTIRQLHCKRVHHRTLLKCRADLTDTRGEEEKEEYISKATLIWRAIKLPIYTVALIPITVGSAAAYLQTGQYYGKRHLMLLVSSFLIIAWLNLSNDVYDFDTGADKNKKESVVNLVGSRTGTRVFAWSLLALGFMGLALVSVEAGSLRPLFLLACAIICGYIYQCPPFRLSYLGLGEPLCFAAFGPFATTAFYLLQKGTRELSISSTIVSSSILIEDDKAVGKYSPLVRLGTEAGSKVVKVAVVALYSLLFVLGLGQTLPFKSVVLCALTLPMGKLVVSFVEQNHKDKTKIFMAKYYCVRLHTVFGAALAAGLVAARMLARKQLPHAIIIS
ncbi:hypothetical protein BUALT_Bualt15G0066900 [Buddleja alternifolia]|uniref:Uncharacterized protein n=1 Tax=Buddleja alternifolia TaxID=168488 RepID=A0AAV6WEM2_9LAMI|nr:hypothetical protein BUALT_Bualt15G0066900 [Buddleja alternifolia]